MIKPELMKKIKKNINNYDWCMKHDRLYKQAWLECDENVWSVIKYYKNVWKKAFSGELACIKYLIQKRVEIIEYLFNNKHLDENAEDVIYKQKGIPPIETGRLRKSF